MYFFAVKAFTRLLRNFFEICRRGGCSILRLVGSLLFLVRYEKMENVKITLLVWNSLAYSVAFFMLYHLSPIKFA